MTRRSEAADWIQGRLDATTASCRERNAAALFLVGRAHPVDRLVSSVYFLLAAPRWARYGEDPIHLAPFVASLDACREPRLALDLGTGVGSSAVLVADRFPNARVVAVDTSRRMLRRARRRFQRRNLEFRRASVRRLPVPAGAVDLVTCLNAVPEPEELRRACAPEGQVLVATSTLPVRDKDSVWVGRWRETGFVRAASGTAGRGSWELYARDG
ncbi:MAG: class I SAM-dependent methyltransferase [Acidimicrobiales bacterium]